MSENSILISKIVKLIIRLHEKKLLCSFLISLVISVFFSVVYGFHFSLYSNDDYNISLLISNGDYNTFYVNSFLSYILVVLQTHFKTINCFVCFQYLGCFASMIALNYVFLQKLSGFIGFLVSVLISSLIFVTDILLVQYSQTAVTLCVAGVALCYAACSLKRRKSIRLWQLVSSVFLIVISSLIRIEPFLVSMAFSVLFIICLIFHRFTKTKNNLKDKIFSAVKIHLSLILFVLLYSCLSLGIYWLSGLVLPTDNIARDYNAARTAVVDYRILPYEGNESFYSEVGINSSIELSKIGFDKERYNTQALNRIAEYSQKVLYGGETRIVFAARNTFDRLINSVKKLYYKFIRIKNTFGIKVSNRLSVAIVLFLFLLFGLIAFLVTRGLFRKSNVRINRRRLFLNLIIVLIWTAFFFVMKIDKNNYLFVLQNLKPNNRRGYGNIFIFFLC